MHLIITFLKFVCIYVKQIIYIMKTEKKNKMVNIRIDSDLIEKFQKHCDKEGYSISKRIRILIKKDINEAEHIN